MKAVLKRLAMANATTLQKKTCQLRRLLQNEDKSSIANSRPPTGALKAAATPAATPAVVNARLEVSQKIRVSYAELERVLMTGKSRWPN